MALQQNPGFMAALGLNLDKEEILAANRKKQEADALGLVGGLGFAPGTQAAANAGAILGSRLSGTPGLTDDQQRKLDAAKATQDRMDEWLAQNSGAQMWEREDKLMEFTAEEAFRHGLPDIGAQAAGMVDEKRRLRKLQDVELEAAGLKVPQMKANLEQTQSSTLANKGLGKYKAIWGYGETNPNRSRMAWIDPATGDALAGPGGEVIAKAGQYTDQAPEAPNAWGRGGKGAGFGATPTEMGQVRDGFAALYRRGETLNEMRDVLEESLDTTGTLAATGNAGKLTSFVSRWANDILNIMEASGVAGEFTAVGRDGEPYSIDTVAGRQKMAKQYQDVIAKYLPPEFRATANQASRWASLVTELMYLEARAAEPGSKQYSDADIERMAAIVGANANNPKTISDIILSSYDRAYSDLQYRMAMYPPQVRPGIIDAAAVQRLDEQRGRVRARWEQPLVETPGTPQGPAKANESDDEFLRRITGAGGAPASTFVPPPAQQTSPMVAPRRGPQNRRGR